MGGVCSQPLKEKQHPAAGKDGQEGEGPPLVQGGEGQSAKEVLRAHREASRASKEGPRGGETKVCPYRSPEGKEAGPEEQQIRSRGSIDDKDVCCLSQSTIND